MSASDRRLIRVIGDDPLAGVASGRLVRPDAARGAVAGWLGALGRAVDALVFPWSCAVCGAEGQAGRSARRAAAALLERAAKAAASACPRCALPAGPYADLRGGCGDCRGRSLGFEAAVALGPYEGTLRELCLRMKHDRDAWLAPWLCDLWVEARGEAVDRLDLPADAWVVPVPLHWRRHWERGYNQAEALARGLARKLDRPGPPAVAAGRGHQEAGRAVGHRPGQGPAQGVPRPEEPRTRGPHDPPGRRRPDHRRHLRRRRPH